MSVEVLTISLNELTTVGERTNSSKKADISFSSLCNQIITEQLYRSAKYT